MPTSKHSKSFVHYLPDTESQSRLNSLCVQSLLTRGTKLKLRWWEIRNTAVFGSRNRCSSPKPYHCLSPTLRTVVGWVGEKRQREVDMTFMFSRFSPRNFGKGNFFLSYRCHESFQVPHYLPLEWHQIVCSSFISRPTELWAVEIIVS